MTVTIKPTRWKHDSGYRRIQIKTETKDANCSDVIVLELPDGSTIRMDSEAGEIRFFSSYYNFKVIEPVCSDAFIKCERKNNDN